MLVKILRMHSLDDAPWTWQSSWNSDMPDFFQGMPNGVYDNIYEDLDDSPVSFHITEVCLFAIFFVQYRACTICDKFNFWPVRAISGQLFSRHFI